MPTERFWRAVLPGSIQNSTITYSVNGKQYVAVLTGRGGVTASLIHRPVSLLHLSIQTECTFCLPYPVLNRASDRDSGGTMKTLSFRTLVIASAMAAAMAIVVMARPGFSAIQIKATKISSNFSTLEGSDGMIGFCPGRMES
jgi:hypothetical protein